MPIQFTISEFLQEQAALYVSGGMTPRERADFELVLEFHNEARQFVIELQVVSTDLILSRLTADLPGPSQQLKSRILDRLIERSQQTTPDAFVMTGPDRLVQWVNPAFTEMCGYSLDELRGQYTKPE